jgi:hypothetical protein
MSAYRWSRNTALLAAICVLSGCSYLLRSSEFRPETRVDPQALEIDAQVANHRDGVIGVGPWFLPVIPWIDKNMDETSYWKDIIVRVTVHDPRKGGTLDFSHAALTLPDGGVRLSPSWVDIHLCDGASVADGLYTIAPTNYCWIDLHFALEAGAVKRFTIEPGAFSRDGVSLALPVTPYRRHTRIRYWPLVPVGD